MHSMYTVRGRYAKKFNNTHKKMATGSDQMVGYGLVVFAGLIFSYYTLWVIVLPFIEPDELIHQFFLPRAYAVILPLVAGVILVTFVGVFAAYIMISKKKKSK